MSRALLLELNKEIRRIYMAGSEQASGDVRLQRLLPQLRQLAERAPVFGKLADGVAGLVEREGMANGSSEESLQELAGLLASVLRTTGEYSTAHVEEQSHAVVIGEDDAISRSYQELTPIIEALTTKGSGRYEKIVEAFESGQFQDMRLAPYAIAALGDGNKEVADYMERHVLPAYGKAILSSLRASLDLAGKKLDARKLAVIAAIGGEEVTELLLQAEQEGSLPVREILAVCIPHCQPPIVS